MSSLRDARATAVRHRLSDLSADIGRWMPVLLDDLDAIDQAHFAAVTGIVTPIAELTDAELGKLREDFDEAVRSGGPLKVLPAEPRPTDAELTAWIENHPNEWSAWVRKQERINGAPPPFDAPASKPPMTALPPAAPKPARTARRPRGGTAT